jgi:hypothetical protein
VAYGVTYELGRHGGGGFDDGAELEARVVLREVFPQKGLDIGFAVPL